MPVGIRLEFVVHQESVRLAEFLYDEQVDLRSAYVQEPQHVVREALVRGLSSECVGHGVGAIAAAVRTAGTTSVEHAQDTEFIVLARADSHL